VSVVFRADGLPLQSHLDYWRQVLSDVFMPIDLRGEFGPDLPAEMRTAELGPIRLNDSFTGAPFRTHRTPRLIRESTPDVFLVGVLVDGESRVEQDGRQATLRPGDLSFVDPTRPSTRCFTAMHTITVSIPKAMIPLRDRELAELTGVRIAGDQGAGALASGLTQQMARRVEQVRAPEAARLGAAVADVLVVALAARLDRVSAVPGARERTLLHRVYAFVEQHLADPELSPRGIAAAHHISLRYLHKLFEAETVTVADWIRRRRLERCRQDLLDPALRDRPVAAVGGRWGLPNAAHFNRMFRAAYGVPPAEFRLRSAGFASDETPAGRGLR
jgi:AraC-like DNA-binding protein